MIKSDLRKLYKQKRLAIASKEKLRLDDLLLIQFQSLDFTGIETVLSYWPMANMGEPNTHLFSGFLRHRIPTLKLCYPKCNIIINTFDAIEITINSVYANNILGITEPKEGRIVNARAIDLILMPLLAFDKEGYRVGYGKGFYDKYIEKCNPDVVLIGFSYFEPVNNIDDIESFDIPLSYCITPNHVFEF